MAIQLKPSKQQIDERLGYSGQCCPLENKLINQCKAAPNFIQFSIRSEEKLFHINYVFKALKIQMQSKSHFKKNWQKLIGLFDLVQT